MDDPLFDRPVFIVNPPRSGSSALFETIAAAPNLYTVGGESHAVIEGTTGLDIASRQFHSNRLIAADATPQIVAELRSRFAVQLRDRDGRPPPPQTRPRLLEKTPKNALRVPFLLRCFPEARFVFLYRDPRETLASMMEAWESGRFRTYPRLPGWTGQRQWSLLLIPGWRDLAPLPLGEIVARQWAVTMQTLLDDLEQAPRERWIAARYDAFVRDPSAEVGRICAAMDIALDRPIGQALPLSRHTVSAPAEDKWRAREGEIAPLMPRLAAIAERAAETARR
jgi:hypothetical protein